MSFVDIIFTVNEAINIGLYQHDIFVTSRDGYTDKLSIELKVYVQPPSWEVDPANYSNSANIIATIEIDEIISTNEDNILSAFYGQECRGTAKLTYNPDYDKYYAYLSVYMDEGSDNITFKVWDAAKGLIRSNIDMQYNNTSLYQVDANEIYGSLSDPVIAKCSNDLEQQVQLSTGWNWISTYLSGINTAQLNKALDYYVGSEGDIIKEENNGLMEIYDGNSWSGNLFAAGLTPGLLYKFKTSQSQEINLEGKIANPADYTINFAIGWNRFGFVGQQNLLLGEAFSKFTPMHNDVVKNLFNFGQYDDNVGWYGNLAYLQPGGGYMYYSGQSISFDFAVPNIMKSGIVENIEIVSEFGEYDYNMPLTASVHLNGKLPQNSLLYAINPKQEICGKAKLNLADEDPDFYLMIHSNIEGEDIDAALVALRAMILL